MPKIWLSFTNQKQWEEYIKNLVKTNDVALYKAIMLIYDRQTPEEKNAGESTEDNCIGFSKIDAKEMGHIARKLKNKQQLSKGEIAKSRNKMQKYWKQLMHISKEQEAINAVKVLQQEMEEEALKRAEEVKRFEEHNELLRKCSEEGVSCSYGICDECILTSGYQMRLSFQEEENE